ncbi:MAG: hypothetical protein ACREFP_12430 [Acetobacteraceae bacterium]
MNEGARPFVERAALAIQELHRGEMLDGWETLLRIDNRAEAADAPFQFDAVHGVLHRRGCRAVPASAGAALYGLWRIGPDEQAYACGRCRPMAEESKRDGTDRTDLLFGLASVIGQFAGVLKERGKDYQKTAEGQDIASQLSSFYRTLGRREKAVVDTVLETLEVLIGKLREADERLNRGSGGSGE